MWVQHYNTTQTCYEHCRIAEWHWQKSKKKLIKEQMLQGVPRLSFKVVQRGFIDLLW